MSFISSIKENRSKFFFFIIISCLYLITIHFNIKITYKNNEISLTQNSNEKLETCLKTQDWIELFKNTGNKHKTDKISVHHYEYLYGINLGPIREETINLLEIGLGCGMPYGPGKSITLWREFFPNATISILEFDKNCAEPFRSQVKNLYTGDQSDFNVLKQLAKTGPYDVIIDDGGHSRKQQINSLIGLWPQVKSGGYYVIEDIFTAFLDNFNDKPSENAIDIMFQLIILLMDGREIGFQTKFPQTPISEISKEIAKDLLYVSCFKRACILKKK